MIGPTAALRSNLAPLKSHLPAPSGAIHPRIPSTATPAQQNAAKRGQVCRALPEVRTYPAEHDWPTGRFRVHNPKNLNVEWDEVLSSA